MTTCYLVSYNLDRLLKSMLTDFSRAIQDIEDESFTYFWKLGLFEKKSISKGGFGLVYDVKCRDLDIVTLNNKSMVVKCNKNKINLEIFYTDGVYAVDYDVSEIYFSALVAYIYRLKVCPFICKYLSVNMVDDEYALFIQRYEWEMLTFPHLTVDLVIQFLFQLTYTVYILKLYLGLVHFDVHLRNVMITKTDRSFLIQTQDDKAVYLPSKGFEIRLIDFGFCLVDLSASIDPFLNNNLKIAPINFKKQQKTLPSLFYSTRSNVSKMMTIELQYFMLHIYQLTKRSQGESHPICVAIRNFGETMYQQTVDFNTPSLADKHVIISNHDVGVDCDIKHPSQLIDGLVRYCSAFGSVDGITHCPFPNTSASDTALTVNFLPDRKTLGKYKAFIDQTIPLVPWFDDTFYNLGSTFGQRISFPLKTKVEIAQEKKDTCLHVLNKNVPFASSNAYLLYENYRVVVVRKRNFDSPKKAFFMGQFLWNDGKAYKFARRPTLLVGVDSTHLHIFHFKFSLNESHVLRLIRENNLRVCIDSSSALGVTYKGDDITLSASALFYLIL